MPGVVLTIKIAHGHRITALTKNVAAPQTGPYRSITSHVSQKGSAILAIPPTVAIRIRMPFSHHTSSRFQIDGGRGGTGVRYGGWELLRCAMSPCPVAVRKVLMRCGKSVLLRKDQGRDGSRRELSPCRGMSCRGMS